MAIYEKPPDEPGFSLDQVCGRFLLGRADASFEMGAGHVARLSALLEAWVESGGRALLLGSGIAGSFRERLVRADVEIRDLPANKIDDADYLRATIKELAAVAVAMDGYHLDTEYQASVREVCPLLYLDDTAQMPQVADLVLNQTVGFDPRAYRLPEHARLLLGAPYLLLRAEFRGQSEPSPAVADTRRIIVSFGGSDPSGTGALVAEALLRDLPHCYHVDLIVGRVGGPALSRLSEVAPSPERVSLAIHTDVRDMGRLFRGAWAAVSAAGSTTWELLACGVPPLLVSLADNQRVVAEAACAAGIALDLGSREDLSLSRLGAAVLELDRPPELRADMISKGKSVIDGRGVYRTIDALLAVIAARTSGED